MILAACLAILSSAIPDWAINSSLPEYPAALYVVGSGSSARSLEGARAAAAADVARQMRSRVTSEVRDRSWQSVRGWRSGAASGETMQHGGDIEASNSMRTDLDVPGIQQVKSIQDAGRWYALAVLDKDQFASASRVRIAELLAQAARDLDAARVLAAQKKPAQTIAKLRACERVVPQVVELRAMIQMVSTVDSSLAIPFLRESVDSLYRAVLDGLTLGKVSGDGQVALVGAPLEAPLVVRLEAGGVGVPGVDLVLTDDKGRTLGVQASRPDGGAEFWVGALRLPDGRNTLKVRPSLAVPSDLRTQVDGMAARFAVEVKRPVISAVALELEGDGAAWKAALKTRLSEAGIRVKDGTPRVLTATWTWTGAAGVKGFSGTVQAGRGKIVFRIEDDEKEVGSALCEGMGSGQGDEPAQRAIAACDLSSLVNQLGSLGPVGQKPRRKVGVVVIDNEDGPSEWVGAGESIARMLETELVRGGKVELLERKKMVNITRETVLAAAGMTKSLTDDFQADGADAVVLGSVVWTGDGLETELRLVEIPSGKVVAATSALIPDRPSMRPEVVRMAKELGKTR